MTFTQAFIAIMVVITLAVDVFLAIFFGIKHTISAVLLTLAKDYPIIPFALGVCAGHLFWQNC